MSHAFFSDQAEKVLASLTADEARAVRSVLKSLEIDPHLAMRFGKRLPGNDPATIEYVIRLNEDDTKGRGISIVYRYSTRMDASMITWLVVGP